MIWGFLLFRNIPTPKRIIKFITRCAQAKASSGSGRDYSLIEKMFGSSVARDTIAQGAGASVVAMLESSKHSKGGETSNACLS